MIPFMLGVRVLLSYQNEISDISHHKQQAIDNDARMYLSSIAALTMSVALASVAAAAPQRFSAVGDRPYYDATIPFPSDDSRSIGGTDANDLFYYLQNDQGLQTVVLNSTGGSIGVATAVSEVIEKFGVDTEVAGRCLSACTLIFLAGKHRSLAKGSVLGFHRSHVSVRAIADQFQPTGDHPSFGADDVADQYDSGEDTALRSVKFMVDHGVDIHFALKALTYEQGDMWIPSRAELTAAGVVTAP